MTDLMRQAMRASAAASKRAVVDAALRLLIQIRRQGRVRRWRGKIAWGSDLATSRIARVE